MRASVWWDPKVPQEVKEPLEQIIEEWGYLLPSWVHELVVKYEGEDGNQAYMSTSMRYRRARLTVTGWFLMSKAADREECIRHEFMHCTLDPLTSWTKDLITRLSGGDDLLCEWLAEEWQDRLEGATCDLERALRQASGQ